MKLATVLEIGRPGLLATLQDYGRFGYQAQGITQGGPLDERAFLWANRLLGNSFNAAQIEITLGGFSATFTRDTLFVVTGAEFPLTLNDQPLKAWRVAQARAGDQLQIASGDQGLRCYLAVAGGFQAAPQLGSVATVMRDALGGLTQDGRPLRNSDRLSAPLLRAHSLVSRRPSSQLHLSLPPRVTLDVIPAAQVSDFSATARELFTNQSYQVTARQDRMGVRIEGESALPDLPGQMISEPLPLGSVQIPTDGQPIAMLNDHQTLGGYPKIGVLSWQARSLLAQLPAGRRVQFRWLELSEAQRQLRQALRFFNVTR
ncbi:5-oxoprolinase subunit C family protein [Pseudidiomarina salilacus]|uniref:5-oxoprolinase subunit C family protein n=1 Tax=Pseudidiomarina salilacus TaxID=3384452 RepID=UPI003984BD2F